MLAGADGGTLEGDMVETDVPPLLTTWQATRLHSDSNEVWHDAVVGG